MTAAAPETPAAPGQAALSPSAYAAYEAYAMAAPDELNFREPDKLDDWEYPAWEAAAQAGYEQRADEEDPRAQALRGCATALRDTVNGLRRDGEL